MEAPLLETIWNEYGDTNLHIVFGDTQNDSFESINALGWRTKFVPNLTYWLSTVSQLGSHIGDFGDGYVPFNIVIGPGYQIYKTESGFDEAGTRQAIASAIANFQFYPQNIVEDKKYILNSENQIDLSGVFFNSTGEEVVYAVSSNSAGAVVGASVNGSILTITSNGIIGTSKITVKGTAGTRNAYFTFDVETYDPAMYLTFSEGFESSWPLSGWTLKTTGDGWKQSSFDSHEGVYSAFHDRVEDVSQNDWLYTPKFKVSENTVLSFWQKGYVYVPNFSTHGVAFSKDLIRYTWLYMNLPPSENWEQVFIDLSSYAGQDIYIGFNYQGASADRWYIDDVRIQSSTGIAEENIISDLKLFQNYPNPFNPSTELSFSIMNRSEVKLTIYNSKGEIAADVFSGGLDGGLHKFSFDASKLNSGVYYYTLEADGKRLTKKMLLLK